MAGPASPAQPERMTNSSRGVRWFGGLGLASGALLSVAAPLAGTELADLLGGYGTMLALSAGYLLGGLWLLGLGHSRRVARERSAIANEVISIRR